VLGLVAAVVLVGILGTAALIVMLRPRTPDAPERTPVTTIARATDGSGLGGEATAPTATVPTTLAAAPPTATATTPPVTRPTAPPTSAPTRRPPSATAETTPAPTAPPPTQAAAATPEPRPATPAAPSFPGAGKIDMSDKFFEKTLAYEVGTAMPFDGHVGPIKAATVQFFVGEKKGRFGKVDDLKTEIRAVFPTLECPKGAGEWDYKLVVELLDESGRRMDKFDGGGSCEDEVKTVAATRAVLKALVPSIRGVKVRLEASKD
jgi:hypothetical protein